MNKLAVINQIGCAAAKRNFSQGFTLIELLIAIAIFISLSSFLLVSYNGNERARNLSNQAQLIVAGLQQAQNMALAGEDVNGRTPTSYQFSIADCQENCNFQLEAIFSEAPKAELISRTNLNAVEISRGVTVDFLPPRGKMELLPGKPDSGILEISSGSAAYCIELNAVSGRINLVSGRCQAIP